MKPFSLYWNNQDTVGRECACVSVRESGVCITHYPDAWGCMSVYWWLHALHLYRQVTRELVPHLQQPTESRPIAPQSQDSRLCLHLPLRSVHAMYMCMCACVCVLCVCARVCCVWVLRAMKYMSGARGCVIHAYMLYTYMYMYVCAQSLCIHRYILSWLYLCDYVIPDSLAVLVSSLEKPDMCAFMYIYNHVYTYIYTHISCISYVNNHTITSSSAVLASSSGKPVKNSARQILPSLFKLCVCVCVCAHIYVSTDCFAATVQIMCVCVCVCVCAYIHQRGRSCHYCSVSKSYTTQNHLFFNKNTHNTQINLNKQMLGEP